MKTDGQLYDRGEATPPPMQPPAQLPKHAPVSKDSLLVMGLIFLLLTDKKQPDLPLIAALLYILL